MAARGQPSRAGLVSPGIGGIGAGAYVSEAAGLAATRGRRAPDHDRDGTTMMADKIIDAAGGPCTQRRERGR